MGQVPCWGTTNIGRCRTKMQSPGRPGARNLCTLGSRSRSMFVISLIRNIMGLKIRLSYMQISVVMCSSHCALGGLIMVRIWAHVYLSLLRYWVSLAEIVGSNPTGAPTFVVSVVCCQVDVSATDWSLVQRSPTDCGASLCVIKKPRKRGG
jgi:hypothetical protein